VRQLALDIRLADHAVFASYADGPNGAAVDSVRRAAAGEGLNPIWLWGAAGTGKSHLLQATVATAHERGSGSAYLPMAELRTLPPAVIDGMGALDLVAVDDVQLIAGQPGWEAALFGLYETLVPRGGRLLLAADGPPGQAGFELRDLASRLTGGAVYRLRRLSDDECLRALQLRARWRGFALPEDAGRYLLGHVERSPARLFRLLDRLDQAALVQQKRLTVPFVKRVLKQDRG
jgi:DnaA family protein